MSNTMTRKDMIRWATNQVDNCNHELEKFAAALAKDPLHAFSWGTSAVKSAALLNVMKAILIGLQDKTAPLKLSVLRRHATDLVLRTAKYPPQSTSPMSNLAEQYTLASWADLLDFLKYEATEEFDEDQSTTA